MAGFLLLLFLFSFHEAQAQTTNFNISLGSSLNSASKPSWLSPSGKFGFGFFKEKNGFAVGIYLAGIPEKMVVWTAYWTDDSTAQQEHIVPSNATLLFTTDGRLMLQAQGQNINIIEPVESIASASMLDNGNFVLYNSKQNIAWQSFDKPTDTLLPGQSLSNDKRMTSRVSETDYSVGFFVLNMQADGNLVMYPINYDIEPAKADYPYAYFSTGTFNIGNQVTLNLDEDGRLYLLNSTKYIKNITVGGYPRQRTLNIMRLDVDGILRVYSVSLDNGRMAAVWNSTDDKCAPPGRCGLNGFCALLGQDISCRCLPGFQPIGENSTSGCGRDFTAVSCKATNQSNAYTMRRSDNTVWDDTPYSVLGANRVEDCEKQCLDDCNCEAAMFKDRKCQKQKLPLRFGRLDTTDTNIALIKVGLEASTSNEFEQTIIREKTEERRTNVVIVGISLIVLAILIVAIGGLFLYRYHKWTYKKIHETQNVEIVNNVTLRAFSYRELVQITNNFNEELGKGSSGTVYKGILSYAQTMVAVKKLERELAEGEREFQTEMNVIAKTHHKNLVSLLGYCIDGTNRLLVYEFMSNGSLADILFASGDPLSWTERVGIATDIVKGILYLHEECKTQIIHCDIKPQNILMDENLCAKISDFGLAKFLKQDQTRTYTAVRGTKGYVAPEWFRKSPVTVKADVYSFGIVLLEIIFHRKNVDWSLPEDEAILDEWVYNCFMAGELSKVVQGEDVDLKKLVRWVSIGIWCIQDEPFLRPSMRKVLLMLEGTVDVPIPPSPQSLFSTL